MSLTLKDAVYLLVYVVSVAGIYFSFRNRLLNLEKEKKREHQIIWQDGGRLNIVDHMTCRDFRDQLWQALRKCDSSAENVLTKLEILNENLIRIQAHLKINGKK